MTTTDETRGERAARATTITEIPVAECWGLLRETEVGRLAVVLDEMPEIFPVNFVVDSGTVVFRTARGTKLEAADLQRVAFEVDGYDPVTGRAWSVVVKGVAHQVRGLDHVLEVVDLPLEAWHSAPKPTFVRIEPRAGTGRRFQARPGTAAGGPSA